MNQEFNPATIEVLPESELWRVSRYIANFIEEEVSRGNQVDKYTIFWALDALMGGADQ